MSDIKNGIMLVPNGRGGTDIMLPVTSADNILDLEEVIGENYDFDNPMNYKGCTKAIDVIDGNEVIEVITREETGKKAAERRSFFIGDKTLKVETIFYDTAGIEVKRYERVIKIDSEIKEEII